MTLTFDRALEIALKDNNSLKVSREQVRAAEGRVQEARARTFSRRSICRLRTHRRSSFRRYAFRPASSARRSRRSRRRSRARTSCSLNFNQPLYTGGRLRNAYAIQAAASDEARLTMDWARQQLMLQVVEAFYRALLHEQGLSVAEEGVKLADQQRGIAKTRFEAGSAARFDVLRAEVELANAKTTLIRAKSSLDIAYREALRSVLSLPPATPLALQGTLEQVERLPDEPELLAKLDARPDFRAITAQRTIAEQSVALANSEWKPSFRDHRQPGIPARCRERHVPRCDQSQLRGSHRIDIWPRYVQIRIENGCGPGRPS